MASQDEAYFGATQDQVLVTEGSTELTVRTTECPEDPIEDDCVWWLDICLDFFACRNPFLDQLAQERGHAAADAIHAAFASNSEAEVPSEEDCAAFVQICGGGQAMAHSISAAARLPVHDGADLDSRLGELEVWMRRRKTAPVCVTVARSVTSGFTPEGQAAAVEAGVLSVLAKVYPQICVHDMARDSVQESEGSAMAMIVAVMERQAKWGELKL